jgi:hypothetical protein
MNFRGFANAMISACTEFLGRTSRESSESRFQPWKAGPRISVHLGPLRDFCRERSRKHGAVRPGGLPHKAQTPQRSFSPRAAVERLRRIGRDNSSLNSHKILPVFPGSGRRASHRAAISPAAAEIKKTKSSPESFGQACVAATN